MGKYFQRLLNDPSPIRFLALRYLDRRFNFLPYNAKLNHGAIERPHYGHCLLQAALLARKLGHSRISAIEFGVAGGNGLVALEMHAQHITRETGIDVAIYGFDSGDGMPPPRDYRDLPYLWQGGYFTMDRDKLSRRLKSAKLFLGPVEETVEEFGRTEDPPPIGFISFDLDYYSSTVAAFKVFEQDHHRLLPRVVCYFDDMVGDIDWAYNEFTGELLAIKEFNEAHRDIKIAPVQGLRFFGSRLPQAWHEQIFVAHLFGHSDYCQPISGLTQLPLVAE
jgi:hypothetical protein